MIKNLKILEDNAKVLQQNVNFEIDQFNRANNTQISTFSGYYDKTQNKYIIKFNIDFEINTND